LIVGEWVHGQLLASSNAVRENVPKKYSAIRKIRAFIVSRYDEYQRIGVLFSLLDRGVDSIDQGFILLHL
jgi:hypothetical protein